MCYGMALAEGFPGNLANLSVRPRVMCSGLCLCLMRAGLPGDKFVEDMRGALGSLGTELDGTCQRRNASCQQSWIELESNKTVYSHSKLRKCDTMQDWGSKHQTGVGR